MEHFPNEIVVSLFMSACSRFLSSFDCLLHFFFFFATGSEMLLLDEEEETSLLELERARLRFDLIAQSNCDNLLLARHMVEQKQTKLGQSELRLKKQRKINLVH